MTIMSSVDFTQYRLAVKRLILAALIELAHNRDVSIVALPYERSVEYCRVIVAMAKSMAIELRNHTGNGIRDDLPVVRPRRYDAVLPLPTPRTVVLYDESARMETGNMRVPAVRSVMTYDGDRVVRTS